MLVKGRVFAGLVLLLVVGVRSVDGKRETASRSHLVAPFHLHKSNEAQVTRHLVALDNVCNADDSEGAGVFGGDGVVNPCASGGFSSSWPTSHTEMCIHAPQDDGCF